MMKVNETFKKWSVLVGCIAIHFCIGVPFLFGNLLTYIVSYMHYRGFYNASNIGDENWIVSPYPTGLAISSTIAGTLRHKVGVRFTLLISNFVFSSGYFLTYITLEHSLWLPIVTYGLICGLGTGAAYVTTIDICSKYFRHHVSTITSLLIAGFSCGAAVFNQVVSFYVNPDNLTPDVDLGSIRVFNQTEVLVRVPNTFLILGGTVFILQIIGIILSFPPPAVDYEDLDLVTNSFSAKEMNNKKPLEIVKDPGGILLWSVTFLTILIFWGVQLIYKNFGQTFIADDHFLSAIGTAGCIVSAIYRIILSLLADKIGTKLIYTVNMILCSVFLFTLYEIRHLERMWYFMWITVLFCGVSIPFVLIPSMVRFMYGSEHFPANFGVIWSGTGIVGFIFPLIIGLLKDIGWEKTIFILAGISTSGFVCSSLLRLPWLPFRRKTPPSLDLNITDDRRE